MIKFKINKIYIIIFKNFNYKIFYKKLLIIIIIIITFLIIINNNINNKIKLKNNLYKQKFKYNKKYKIIN